MTFADRLDLVRQQVRLLPLAALSAGFPLFVIAVGLATHHADLLRLLLPALLPVCAVAIWHRDRSAYFGFVLAVWFFIPFVRRIVDYSAGPLDPSPILLAPYLTTLAVPMLRLPSQLKAPIATVFPFILCFIGIFLGLAIGLFAYPITSVAHDFLNWATPVAFAAFLTLEEGADYNAALQVWLPRLIVACALYTLAQFAFAFPWDMAWLVSLDAPSQGGTAPFALRAFGPLNSAGTAAFVLSAGSLFILNQQRWWRIPALLVTIAALSTTQVRAGYLVVVIGSIITFFKSPKGTAAAMGVLLAIGVIASIFGLQTGNQSIADRFASFQHPSEDSSANGRMEGYSVAWNDLESHPLGHGLGVPEDIYDIAGSFSLLDSAPIHIWTTFGWLGSVAYCLGLVLLLFPTLCGIALSDDKLFLATAIPAVSLTCIFLFGSITVALSGFLIWSFLPAALSRLKENAPMAKTSVSVRAILLKDSR